MTRPAFRVTTRVLPTGEVIVVVEPIPAAERPSSVDSEDRNIVADAVLRAEGRP